MLVYLQFTIMIFLKSLSIVTITFANFFPLQMTWCDVYFMTAIEAVTEKFDVKLTNYPKLKQLFDKLQKEPRILEWTQKRPEKK